MSWITITEAYVQTKLAGAELIALKTSALASGQSDPVAEIITQVTNEIRGYVAANHENTLGAAGTIPEKLLSAAVAIIRFRSATRLPVKTFLTDDRVREYEAAIRLLERVADAKFSIEDPVSGEESVGAIEQTSAPVRRATRATLEGL